MSIRPADIEWISMIVRSSGIASLVQREAIVRRIKDAWEERKLLSGRRSNPKENQL